MSLCAWCAQDNNGVPYCNCDGTGRSGVNCQLGAPAPAPVPGVSSPSTGTPGPSTAYAPVSFPTSSVSAKAPTIASELPPTGASYVKGACPAGYGLSPRQQVSRGISNRSMQQSSQVWLERPAQPRYLRGFGCTFERVRGWKKHSFHHTDIVFHALPRSLAALVCP